MTPADAVQGLALLAATAAVAYGTDPWHDRWTARRDARHPQRAAQRHIDRLARNDARRQRRLGAR